MLAKQKRAWVDGEEEGKAQKRKTSKNKQPQPVVPKGTYFWDSESSCWAWEHLDLILIILLHRELPSCSSRTSLWAKYSFFHFYSCWRNSNRAKPREVALQRAEPPELWFQTTTPKGHVEMSSHKPGCCWHTRYPDSRCWSNRDQGQCRLRGWSRYQLSMNRKVQEVLPEVPRAETKAKIARKAKTSFII